MIKTRFHIQALHCVGCAMTLDGAVEDLPGVKSATTHCVRQVAEVECGEKQVTDAQIGAAYHVLHPSGIRKVLGHLEADIMEIVWARPADRGTTVWQ